MKTISIVLPTYNEEEGIELFWDTLTSVIQSIGNYNFDVVFINDGSTDKTFNKLLEFTKEKDWITLVNLDKNYGHPTAIGAGLDITVGDAVITMDSDLQDPPEVIKLMIEKWEEGSKIVFGTRTGRRDGFFKDLSAMLFYKIMKILSGGKIPENTADFRLMDKEVVKIVNEIPASKRFLRGFIPSLDFKKDQVHYLRPQRKIGESKYSFSRMLTLALDGIRMQLRLSKGKLKQIEYKIEGIYKNGKKVN